MAALELAEPGVRNLLVQLFFGDCSDKQAREPLQRLVKAYVAQQSVDVRQPLDAVAKSDVLFALIYCLDDLSGSQNNATSGPLRKNFKQGDYIARFRSPTLLRECLYCFCSFTLRLTLQPISRIFFAISRIFFAMDRHQCLLLQPSHAFGLRESSRSSTPVRCPFGICSIQSSKSHGAWGTQAS